MHDAILKMIIITVDKAVSHMSQINGCKHYTFYKENKAYSTLVDRMFSPFL